MFKMITMFMICAAFSVNAETAIDNGTSSDVFKVDGKVVSALEAAQLAPKHDVERCKPIKGATTSDGKDALAYKCKSVVYMYAIKTGAGHWKTK